MADDLSPQNDTEEGAPEWMVTFADMMSLLLTFFILLLSFASMDVERFKSLAESMRESFTFNALPIPGKTRPASTEAGEPDEPKPPSPETVTTQPNRLSILESEHQRRLKEIKRHIDSYINKADLEMFIQTKLTGTGLIIVNSDPLGFMAGRADLESNSVQYLEALLPALQRYDYDIVVEGHTDNRPIQTSEFHSNWELSTARASRFARYLIELGIAPERLSVTGYAEFKPVAPNDTPENRAKNRRIEIMLKHESDKPALAMP